MISEKRLEQALTYRAQTDEDCAQLRADMERAEFRAKATRDAIFKRLDGSVADRTAEACTTDEYLAAMEEYFRLLKAYEAMRNKRATEEIIVEVWRSINASRRQGNV